jgi:hypothetical protein
MQTQPPHASKSIKQRTQLRLMLIHHRHRTTHPTHIDTSRDASNVHDSFLVHTNRPRCNAVVRLVTHALIPAVTQMTCAHGLICPRMENLSVGAKETLGVNGTRLADHAEGELEGPVHGSDVGPDVPLLKPGMVQGDQRAEAKATSPDQN